MTLGCLMFLIFGLWSILSIKLLQMDPPKFTGSVMLQEALSHNVDPSWVHNLQSAIESRYKLYQISPSWKNCKRDSQPLPLLQPDMIVGNLVHLIIRVNQFSPRIAQPDKYDDSFGKCKGFLMQCSILFASSTSVYHRDVDKIQLMLSMQTGWALTWAIAMFNQGKRDISALNDNHGLRTSSITRWATPLRPW